MRQTNLLQLEQRLLSWMSKEKLAEVYFTTDNQETKAKILNYIESLNKPLSNF